MDDLREYVVALFSRCKNPVKQVELICELTGNEMETVLGILRDAGRVPKNVTVKNYKKVLSEPIPREITDELRHHLIASNNVSEILARRYGVPVETVRRIREEAYRRVGGRYTDGSGTLKEFEEGCPRYAKNAAGNGKRAGKRNRRVRQKRTVGA